MNASAMSAADARELVTQLYRVMLHRNADKTGMKHYSDALRSVGAAEAVPAFVANVLGSEEFHTRIVHLFGRNRDHINARVKEATEMRVYAGPFAGMKLIDRSNRGDGDVSPKLLGTYEQDIQPALDQFAQRAYDSIIDVGCAEGYYSIGLALRFPGVPVFAFDTDEEALAILMEGAALNGCAEQMRPGGFCDPDALIALLDQHPRSLLIIDCEAYEKVLFGDPRVAEAARRSDAIIECHDLWDPEITPTIRRTLKDTHDVRCIEAGARNPYVFPFLREWDDWDRWMAVWERRIGVQNWLVCEGRGPAA